MTGYTIRVPISDCGAAMTIPYPYGDPHIEWMMRYGNMCSKVAFYCLKKLQMPNLFLVAWNLAVHIRQHFSKIGHQ